MANTFNSAFAAARKKKGAGATFTWQGKSYSTNTAEDLAKKTKKPAANPRNATSASPIRPKARSEAKPKAMTTAPKAPTQKVSSRTLKAVSAVKDKPAAVAKDKPVVKPIKGGSKLYKEGSAYGQRKAKASQYLGDIERALYDQRLNNAESEVSGAARSTAGKTRNKK